MGMWIGEGGGSGLVVVVVGKASVVWVKLSNEGRLGEHGESPPHFDDSCNRRGQ